jgi:hypothetical protein
VPERPELAELRAVPSGQPNGSSGRRRGSGRAPAPVELVWTTPTSGQLGVPFSFCPGCGASLDRPNAFVQELWVSQESVFHVWCPSCGFVGNVVPVHRMIGHEAVDE